MHSATGLLANGYWAAFVTVFVGGFLTSLTPCVYPMIGITVSIFGARDENVTRARALTLATAYVLGMCLMYTGLGILAGMLGAQFGVALGKWWIVIPMCLLFLAMAASMFGAFELDLPSGLKQRLSGVGGKGYLGAFLMGLVGGIIAAPCTGPVLASVLTYISTTRSVAVGGSLMFVYALGMGSLFFVVAVFMQKLPKSGAWMDAVKSIFGITMIGLALYFLRPIIHLLRDYGHRTPGFLGGAIAVAALGVALGAVHLSFHDSWPKRIRKGAGIALTVVGGFSVVTYLLTPKPLPWIHGEAIGVAAAKSAHKPALLDFYADWCIPCKEMEIGTFNDQDVARELERFTLVKVDTSNDDDPQIIDVKKKYGADTLPTVVLLDAEGRVAKRWNKQVTPDEFLPELQKLQ